MEVRHTVRRFPGAAFALILGLVAALAVVMTLSIGGWGLAIPGPASVNTAAQPVTWSNPGSPATETQPTTVAPDATTQPVGVAPAADQAGPACAWQQGAACSTSP
jgi:hypothetical protein